MTVLISTVLSVSGVTMANTVALSKDKIAENPIGTWLTDDKEKKTNNPPSQLSKVPSKDNLPLIQKGVVDLQSKKTSINEEKQAVNKQQVDSTVQTKPIISGPPPKKPNPQEQSFTKNTNTTNKTLNNETNTVTNTTTVNNANNTATVNTKKTTLTQKTTPTQSVSSDTATNAVSKPAKAVKQNDSITQFVNNVRAKKKAKNSLPNVGTSDDQILDLMERKNLVRKEFAFIERQRNAKKRSNNPYFEFALDGSCWDTRNGVSTRIPNCAVSNTGTIMTSSATATAQLVGTTAKTTENNATAQSNANVLPQAQAYAQYVNNNNANKFIESVYDSQPVDKTFTINMENSLYFVANNTMLIDGDNFVLDGIINGLNRPNVQADVIIQVNNTVIDNEASNIEFTQKRARSVADYIYKRTNPNLVKLYPVGNGSKHAKLTEYCNNAVHKFKETSPTATQPEIQSFYWTCVKPDDKTTIIVKEK